MGSWLCAFLADILIVVFLSGKKFADENLEMFSPVKLTTVSVHERSEAPVHWFLFELLNPAVCQRCGVFGLS